MTTSTTESTAPKTERKPTTTGRCHICGSGSCAHWRFAALDEDKRVDVDALLKAHGVTPAIVEHDAEGKVTGGAAVLVPMESKPSATYTKHGGRVAPLPVRKATRR